MMKLFQTAERVSHTDASDNFVYQRSLLAYLEAAKRVSGNVLEIGTGSGYGIEYIASSATKFVTLDKHQPEELSNETLICSENVRFIQIKVPPLTNVPDNYFDFVITFQVIEHIKDHKTFVREIFRILKPGGKVILTTPNIKTSLTRNPWHVREYTVTELEELLNPHFESIEKLGVYGGEKAMAYYEKNKESVRRITRFDIFNLQYILPRHLLQIPYDILNRINRKKLLKNNNQLASTISLDDYYLDQANDQCIDLFYVATKE